MKRKDLLPEQWARTVIKAHFEGVEPSRKFSSILDKRAACFVSIYDHDGKLRGSYGTFEPIRDNLFEEIENNVLRAAMDGSRFPILNLEEVGHLIFSVDILSPLNIVENAEQLDSSKYGIVVSYNGNVGALLPRTKGVDSVQQQLEVACKKGGFKPSDEGVVIERFSVSHFGELIP